MNLSLVSTVLLVAAGALPFLPANVADVQACTSEVYAYRVSGATVSVGDYVTIGTVVPDQDYSCGGHDFYTLHAGCVVSTSCGPTGATSVDIAGTSLSGDYHVTAVSSGCLTMCRCQ